MAADLPENYEKRPDAFQFIRDVPTDWETSRTLQGEIGDYVVIARQQRGTADWYLGATTDENARNLDIPLDFLPRGRRYEAQIYRDAPGADYRSNPAALVIEKRRVTSQDQLGRNARTGRRTGGAFSRAVSPATSWRFRGRGARSARPGTSQRRQ